MVLILQYGFSQDWELFVKDQNSYYKQQYNNSAKVENFLFDSILVKGDFKIMYFNAKSSLKDECYKEIKQKIYYDYWFKNSNKIDSLIQNDDSILFISDYYSKIDTFLFKPYIKLNDTWITNGITIKCSNLGIMDIFGEQDSVKTFVCNGNNFDNIKFILSKRHGLIEFLPFNEIIFHSNISNFSPYFELIGFNNGETSRGYTQPEFNDYFHLKAGDILYWKDYTSPIDITIPTSTTYHIDSITFVFISSDSIYYDYKRIDYDKIGAISRIGYYSNFHLRKDEGVIVKNHTSWFGLKYDRYQSNEIFFLESLYFKIENDDTITYLQYQLPGLFIDTANCQAAMAADYDWTVGFSTREGNIFQGTYSWGESSSTLIGSIINGIKYSETNIPTKIVGVNFDELNIFPNPFVDYLNIELKDNFNSQLQIYDLLGNIIISTIHKDKIDLSGLNPGIYILRIINNNGKIRQIKIIKQ